MSAARLAANEQLDRQLTLAAATGDLEAQRALLTTIVGTDLKALELEQLCAVEMLARFLAIRGDPFDVRRFAAVLHALAFKMKEQGRNAEAVAGECAELLRYLADGGDGPSMTHLADFAGDFPDAWEIADSGLGAILFPVPDLPSVVPPQSDDLGQLLSEAFAHLPSAADGKVRAFIRDLIWRVAIALDAFLDRKATGKPSA